MRLPLFFPKTIKKIIARQENRKPRYYNLSGVEIYKPENKIDISQPIYDFQAGTTATITPITETLPITPAVTFELPISVPAGVDNIPDTVQEVVKEQVSKSNIFIAYCVKCKCKHEVNNPVVTNMDTKKGVKGILRGSCSVCGTKMGALVQRL